MRRRVVICALALACTAADWKIAEPGWQYEFPRDHHLHEDFKTEWWYFTGNLTNESGRRFGYELTFFRQGIRSPSERTAATSRFIVNDLKFAHFTVTDTAGKTFWFQQKVSRGSFGDAGFANNDRIAWIDSWHLKVNADGSFDLAADVSAARIQFHVRGCSTMARPQSARAPWPAPAGTNLWSWPKTCAIPATRFVWRRRMTSRGWKPTGSGAT